MPRPLSRLALIGATALVVGAIAGLPPVTPAAAATRAQLGTHTQPASSALGDAQAQARALRVRVDALQVQAEQATEAYNAAYDALGRAVTAHLSAQATLDQATGMAGATTRTADRRVRALYISGGAPALYASVLQGTSLNDVLDRLRSVQAVVGGDRHAASSALQSMAARARAEARLAALAQAQTRLEMAVATHADEVRTVLAQTATLLAQADSQVRALAEQQRREQEAAAARAAAAALAQARARALTLAGSALPTTAAPTAAAGVALAAAESHLGAPYLWGGTGPDAFDCSGLTMTAYRAAGINLPRTAAEQYFAGPPVDLGSLAPGDLLFWATDVTNPATIHHEAMYLGNGLMVAAPHTGAVVRVQPVYLDGYFGAIRPSVGPTLKVDMSPSHP